MEEWKNLIDLGFSKYEISNYGKIRNIETKRILKSNINRYGYLKINLMDEFNERKTIEIHRLVALIFIPNNLNKSQVNHKDGVKTNNHYTNLEWVTRRENQRHASKIGLRDKQKILVANKLSKKLYQLDLLTNQIIKEYRSLREAERLNNFARANISNCCNGKSKQAYGFNWIYKEGNHESMDGDSITN